MLLDQKNRMDKFLLLRSWQKQPLIGPEAAQYSKKYFSTAALVIGGVTSSYLYAGFPYTYVCDCDSDDHCNISTTTPFNVTLLDGTGITIQTSPPPPVVRFCDQHVGFSLLLPKVEDWDEWMTPSQWSLTRILGWTSLGLIILYLVGVLGRSILKNVLSYWKGVYSPSGVDQKKDFSSIISIETFGYIPQIHVPGFAFPFLACDVDGVDVNLIGWRDPNLHNEKEPHKNYDSHNLILDVPTDKMNRYRHKSLKELSGSGSDIGNRPIFSIVKHWPPSWAIKENQDTA